MKVAVIGGGVSGLVSAYLLSKAHDVVLFERNDYFGGHSHTVCHETAAGEVQLDTGFIVYNEPAYPRFSCLLSELGVASQASDMSFSVSCHACKLAYSSRGLAGILARPNAMLRPRNLRLGLDILRFYRDAPASMGSDAIAGLTLAQYLAQRGYSGEFRRHFIVPLAAAVWSMPPSEVDGFPAAYMLRFLYNHGLVGGDKARWRWRTVTGGSCSYVEAIIGRLGERAYLCPVESVTRTAEGIEVQTADGARSEYDAAIMACHADEARVILRDADSEEEAALGMFAYTQNRVVLHTDASLLPEPSAARASWNYVTRDCRSDKGLALTYHLNRLQAIDSTTQYCVSMNPTTPIAEDAVIREMAYRHPKYGFDTLEGQQRIEALQGTGRVYYAGAHLGYGFHEDGVQSAYRVAAMLGVES